MLSKNVNRSAVALVLAACSSACGGAAQPSTNPGSRATVTPVLASPSFSSADQCPPADCPPAPAPQPPFNVTNFKDVTARFASAPKLQSFAFARYTDGIVQNWIFIAGRTNGFHGFGNEQDFPPSGANTKIWVIQDVYGPTPAVVSMDVSRLPSKFSAIIPQWQSSNPLFYQDFKNGILYIAGGYGPDANGKYQTFPYLSAVSIGDLYKAVISNDPSKLNNSIAFVNSPLAQSTGGEMLGFFDGNNSLNLYVVMGHNFDGKYSGLSAKPATATQTYLKAINQFRASPDFQRGTISLTPVKVFSNADQFGRRDLNVAYTVMQDGQAGIGAYGGVFTPNPTQLNYFFPIYLGQGPGTQTPIIDTTYEQKMSAYSCAKMVFYSRSKQATYTTFFGGISRWRFDDTLNMFVENARIGVPDPKLTFSDGMPWINTITTLTHTWTGPTTGATSELAEPKTKLPGYLGSEALFIPRTAFFPALTTYAADIVDFDSLPKGVEFSLGYLYGGIKAMPSNFYLGVQAESGRTKTDYNDKVYEVFVTIPESSN